MNDKIKINLQIADSNYPLTINREGRTNGTGSRQTGKCQA